VLDLGRPCTLIDTGYGYQEIKKACIAASLDLMVGRERFELSTNGLRAEPT